MSHHTIQSLLGDPPDGFGRSFFTWVEHAQETADVIVVDLSEHPLSEEDIQYIESLGACTLPSDIRTYYQYCSPWGIWRHPHKIWGTMFERVTGLFPHGSHLIPIDINSQPGNILIAYVVSDDHYHLIFIDRYKETRARGEDIRQYIIENLLYETIVYATIVTSGA